MDHLCRMPNEMERPTRLICRAIETSRIRRHAQGVLAGSRKAFCSDACRQHYARQMELGWRVRHSGEGVLGQLEVIKPDGQTRATAPCSRVAADWSATRLHSFEFGLTQRPHPSA